MGSPAGVSSLLTSTDMKSAIFLPSSWWPQSTPRLWLRPRPLLTLITDTTDTTGSPTDTLDTATTDTAISDTTDMASTTARGRLRPSHTMDTDTMATAMDTMAMDMDMVIMVMDMDTGTMAMDIMDTSTDRESRVEDSAEIRLSFNRNIYVRI